MSNCPKCGSQLPMGAISCPACGEPINFNISPEMATTPAPMNLDTNVQPANVMMDSTLGGLAAPAPMPMEGNVAPAPMPAQGPMQNATVPTTQSDGANLVGQNGIPVATAPVALTPLETVPVPNAPVSLAPLEATPLPSTPSSVADPLSVGVPGVATPTLPPEMPGAEPTSVAPGLVPLTPLATPVQDMPVTPVVPPVVDEEKKRKKETVVGKIIAVFVILVSIVALAVMAFFISKMSTGNNAVVEEKPPENVKEYHYEGFYLYVPDNLYAEIYDGNFYIGDLENAWSAVMVLQPGTYNILASNKSQLISYFTSMGYETTEPVEKEINGTSFVMTEVMMGTKNVLVAYTKANGTQVFGIVLENETGEYNDDILRPIGSMLASMTFEGQKFELPAGFKLDEFKKTFSVAE